MRRTLTVFLLMLPLLARAGGEAPLQEQAREVVREFAGTLRETLTRHLSAGGPVEAIEACRLKAPAIAAGIGEKRGWEVGRTSLRTRNPANDPDPWERRVLEQFEARKAAGEDPARLEYHEVIERQGRRLFRYMKAIPTAPLCLTCHGGSLAPELATRLDELYPQDRARGFSVGDLRGAFTLQRELED
ncbi:MAG: DUF3365 domain-containing protein [Gammaproteobacteria bacterium]|nr:MAG: DUF3365 domain-containing protein [Gammaproteobacteria bacterium]